MILTKRYTW